MQQIVCARAQTTRNCTCSTSSRCHHDSREKRFILLISGKTDIRIRRLCMFSKCIFYARGLKPAILLYDLWDNSALFLEVFLLLSDLYFTDRQINITKFPRALLCPCRTALQGNYSSTLHVYSLTVFTSHFCFPVICIQFIDVSYATRSTAT